MRAEGYNTSLSSLFLTQEAVGLCELEHKLEQLLVLLQFLLWTAQASYVLKIKVI